MALTLNVNGVNYSIPEKGESPNSTPAVDWGVTVTSWMSAVTSGMLQKAGGSFALTAEVDFGASFGLKSAYYKSQDASPAAAGIVRLGNTESISWRNAADGADLSLAVNGSDQLTYESKNLQPLTTRGDIIIRDATGDNVRLPIGTVNQVLQSDGTDISWANLAGTGDVVGPGSATDNALARFDTTTGKLLQNSVGILDDSGNLSGIANVTASGHIHAKLLAAGEIRNIGISLSGGTLTIHDADTTALSASNPGYVTMKSVTAGQIVTLAATANASFNDDAHASSDLNGIDWGIKSTANWSEDAPFFLYVVNRGDSDLDGSDGNSAYFLARNFAMHETPSDADDIGDTDAAPVNDSQDVILLLGSYTQANYTSLPCQMIGAIRMQWLSSTTDWTVQTLGNTDGIGPEPIDATFAKTWNFPLGQTSADSNNYFLSGGTAPTWATPSGMDYVYQIKKNGNVSVVMSTRGGGNCTAGSAASFALALPYDLGGAFLSSTSSWGPCGAYAATSSAQQFGVLMTVLQSVNDRQTFMYEWDLGALLGSEFSNVGDDIDVRLEFSAY